MGLRRGRKRPLCLVSAGPGRRLQHFRGLVLRPAHLQPCARQLRRDAAVHVRLAHRRQQHERALEAGGPALLPGQDDLRGAVASLSGGRKRLGSGQPQQRHLGTCLSRWKTCLFQPRMSVCPLSNTAWFPVLVRSTAVPMSSVMIPARGAGQR